MNEATAVPIETPDALEDSADRAPARWPLILLALPAAVATWSGWVGLGEKTGFGVVKLLPGLREEFEINTAIVLPIGVEAYAAYALGTWLSKSAIVSQSTRVFAKWSSIGSLVLGALGQIAYHLLEVAGYATAPVWVTAAVSCLPVLVLGMGAGLGHMIARDAHAGPAVVPAPVLDTEAVGEPLVGAPELGTADAEEDAPDPAPVPVVPVALPAQKAILGPVPDELCPTAAFRYADELAEGKTPALKRLKAELRIGQERAMKLRAYLGQLAEATR